MPSADSPRPYSYVAYIDEAGDDGLRKVRPRDPDGASEWLVLSAVVIDASREAEVIQWLRDAKVKIKHRQSPDIHFARLGGDGRKLAVCEHLAQLPVRAFAVVSNKKNMRGHTNPRAEKIPARNWFYCWMGRLLLERVTAFCGHRNALRGTPGAKMKIEFSERGGMSYSQFKAYLHWIKLQSRGNQLFLQKGDLDWSVVSTDLIEPHNHRVRAGLQLADTVASAFYQAVEMKPDGTCAPSFAKALEPRMARNEQKRITDFGVKAMPSPLWRANLRDPQKEIFRFYGYTPGQIGR